MDQADTAATPSTEGVVLGTIEQRALSALLPGQRFRWMKAHLKQVDVDSGGITAYDYQGNQHANQGTAQHGPLEPDATWLTWADFANITTSGARSDRNFVTDQKLSQEP
eukprot:5627494-Amphidinium_carterae.1